ncbi:MAG: HEAT repeat domain-containing protein, partial [Verrucomicrobiota bacterium]
AEDIEKLLTATPFVHSAGFPDEYEAWYREMEAPMDTGSSATDRCKVAREKMKRNHDDSNAQKIVDALLGDLKEREYCNLVFAVSCLLKNTGNPIFKKWFSHQCLRRDLKHWQKDWILLYFGDYPESKQLARRSFFGKTEITFSIDALATNPTDEDVDALIQIARKSLNAKLLVIFALKNAKATRAIPYLLKLARRRMSIFRFPIERDWRNYSILALGTMGDKSVVPELCKLMDRRGADPFTIRALETLGDSRGLFTSIKHAKILFAKEGYYSRASAGTIAPVYNALLLAKKTGNIADKEVSKWIVELNGADARKRLHQEECDLIDEIIIG